MKQREAQIDTMMLYFHRMNILDIKNSLGDKCTYVSHVRYPNQNKYTIIAKFRKEKPILALLNGTPQDIKPEYYKQLKMDMRNEAKSRGLL